MKNKWTYPLYIACIFVILSMLIFATPKLVTKWIEPQPQKEVSIILQLEKNNKICREDLSQIVKDEVGQIVVKETKEYYDRYRDDVLGFLNQLLAFVTIVVGLFGIGLPFFINRNYEERFSELEKKTQDSQEKAKTSEDNVEILKKQIEDLKVLVEKSEKEAMAYALFSQAQYEEDLDTKIKLYSRVIKFIPNKMEAYNNRGNAYVKKGDYDKAIGDFNKAIVSEPSDARVYCNRGNAYVKKGDYDKAIGDFTEAIALKSDYALAYYNRGVAYERKEDYDKALVDYDNALIHKPDYEKAIKGKERASKEIEKKENEVGTTSMNS